MQQAKTYFLFLGLSLLFLSYAPKTLADTLSIQENGLVILHTDSGSLKKVYYDNSTIHSPSVSNVLGSSTGVTVTISVSSFLPTDTPRPTPTSTPTSRPTISTASNPIATPKPTLTPTPPPLNTLIATITTPTTTTTEAVTQVTQQPSDVAQPIIITSSPSHTVLITQGSTTAETTSPIQLNNTTHTMAVLVQGISYAIVPPTKAIDTVQTKGSYIIPSTIKITLTTQEGKAVYLVKGNQHIEILGHLIVSLPLTIIIDATNSHMLETKNSILVNFIEFFHIGHRVIS